MTGTTGELTALLAKARAGDAGAANRLWKRVEPPLRKQAAAFFRSQRRGHTLQPTALVNEVYLRLTGGSGVGCTDRRHFFTVAARAMRQILINHEERHRALKRGGKWQRVPLQDDLVGIPGGTTDILDLDAALKELSRLDDRKAQLVELRFFGGLTVNEVASVLRVSKRTAEEDWAFAKAWLSQRLASHDESRS